MAQQTVTPTDVREAGELVGEPGNPISAISYMDLYRRWERGNWRATEIDFSEDREHWRSRMTAEQRRGALWNYTLFFHGEAVVAETLAPFIAAAPRAEQKQFLTTQQVDEARHAVFFGRFMTEVVEQGSDVESALAVTSSGLTWGFRRLFGHLERVAADLSRAPTLPKLAAAIALYHIVIEATLGQPGQHFIEDYLNEMELLPGLREGIREVSRDEQRHIAFGVKLLSELVADDPACREAVAKLLRKVSPWALASFVPPNWDRSYTEALGFSLEDIYAEAQRSFEQKLRAAGLPVDSLWGAAPFPLELSPRDRAERLLLLLRAGMLGEKTGPPARDAAAVEAMFDTVRLSIDTRHTPRRPTTIQWRFPDLEPWHLTLANGDSSVARGDAPHPDLVLTSQFETWVDIFAGREDPRAAFIKRKLRPSGRLALLWRLQKMLPR